MLMDPYEDPENYATYLIIHKFLTRIFYDG